MKHYLIADRYARSLSGAIEDDSQLEDVLERLRTVSELVSSNHELHSVIANPAIAVEKRVAILDAILERGEAPELLKKLLAAMVQRGRVADVADAVVFAWG